MNLPPRRAKPLSSAAIGTKLLNEVRDFLSGTSDVLIWRNNVGLFRHLNSEGLVRCGMGKGSCDLLGIVVVYPGFDIEPLARFLAVEVKVRGPQDLSADQRAYINVINGFGGAAACVSSIAEANAFIEKAKQGERFEKI
jgi:hypothetical protein